MELLVLEVVMGNAASADGENPDLKGHLDQKGLREILEPQETMALRVNLDSQEKTDRTEPLVPRLQMESLEMLEQTDFQVWTLPTAHAHHDRLAMWKHMIPRLSRLMEDSSY